MMILLLFLATLPMASSQYANTYDHPVLFQCRTGQAISHVRSRHHNGAEDRQYGYSCRTVRGFDKCHCEWHGYVNGFDEIVLFQCPKNGVISGVNSYHHNGAEDRRFKYYCCYPRGKVILKNCAFSNFVNTWDAPVNFHVPDGKVLKGVFSVHHSGSEDRRFRYETCNVHEQ